MPKEIIESRFFGQKAKDAETGKDLDYLIESTYAHVGWTKERDHVELAVLNPVPGAILSGDSGWFVQLDRAGINRLIRVLRQARDQAYGRDE